MLMDQLQTDLNTSLKAGKRERVETLRFLVSGIRNSAIAKYGNAWETSLKDADIIDVVKKQAKTHRESIEAFQKAGREDLVAREKTQLTILEEMLPKEISDEDLRKILAPVVDTGETNFGLLMKQAMATVAGRADGGRVARLLKQMISINPKS